MTQVGFIGQGFVGKSIADDFENRGYPIVRYQNEGPLQDNKKKIKECDIVFIAVPTPTTSRGFDDSIVREVVSLVGEGKTAVIKSTLVPGTTESIQGEYPDKIVLCSPEFLLEKTAAEDAAHPIMNIIGLSEDTDRHRKAAETVMSVLPESPHKQICLAREAELIKYTHNVRAYGKIIMSNLFYDLAEKIGCHWEEVRKAMDADPMFTNWYNNPVHQGGRGAGGHCFIKDFAAFVPFYKKETGDEQGSRVLLAMEQKNNSLLRESGKNIDLLDSVYK